MIVLRIQQNNQAFFFEKSRLKSEFQQTLLQSQLEIQEQTFKNISQEIHDNIGQALTLAKLNLNTLPGINEQQLEKINTSKTIISKVISDLRDLSRSLNTDYVTEMGLQQALEYELGLINKSGAIQTNLHTSGEPFRMEQQHELILFRIVQEALNNIMKHAEAATINARLNYGSDKLELLLNDDGKGFSLAAVNTGELPGLGLRNMQNRAKLIGASFWMSSIPGSGTELKITVSKNSGEIDKGTAG
jgi:signal transduction histidine kinase